MKQYLMRLDHVASELNFCLLAITIGLAMLDFSVTVAKCSAPFTLPPASLSADPPGQVVAQPSSSTTRDIRG